jgi:hypothetical protein
MEKKEVDTSPRLFSPNQKIKPPSFPSSSSFRSSIEFHSFHLGERGIRGELWNSIEV